jgi:hypothetical protein
MLEYFGQAAGGTFTAACSYAGIPYSSAYKMRKDDPVFAEALDQARTMSNDIGGDFAESK